ncbi:extracellular solute-binding protein [Streptomyces sp. CBMA29]|uniref:extracellular solute-binding protein n=1 Tax=Streptomyces sp. CBMA29 TaxID=1896314 RepID=UPI001661FB2E|nr:extracellular solute-binding protein [Streptomyces sp. CBMA29]MBD0735715.1 sugar ABC transporter substrate-binding protein [Streptomyces sp. CBMA29]
MRRRHTVALAVTAVLAATAVTGCGSDSGSGSSSKKTINTWVYPVINDPKANDAYWDGMVKGFEKENPGVTVKVSTYPWANRDTALATALAAGKGPDVAYLIPDQLAGYQRNLIPADKWVPAADKAAYRPAALKAVTVDGQQLAAPVLMSSYPLLCDKKVFDAIGETSYPTTWDQLAALAPTLKAKGFYATSYSGDTTATLNMTFYPLLWQAGGDVFSSDGTKATFNSAAGVKALTWLKTFVDNGWTPKDLVTTTPQIEQTDLAKNKVACTWQNAAAEVEPFWGKENIHVGPALSSAKSVAYGTVGTLAVFKGANQQLAGKWVSYISQPKNTAGLQQPGGYFSARTDASPLYPGDKLQEATEQVLGSTDVGPLDKSAREVMGLLAPQIQAALLGKTTPQKALDDAAKAADQLIARKR